MSRINSDYEVIVVGGGPAGAATATHLARAGHAVLLLDRAAFPRDKPCGEFFSPPVRGLLSTLGVYDEVRACACDVPAASIYWGDAPACSGRFTAFRHAWSPSGGFSVERRLLDAALWRNAAHIGADARGSVAVRWLRRDRAGRVCGIVTDTGEFSAAVVVGADGGRSRVAREMGVVLPAPRLQKIALVSHYAVRSDPWEDTDGLRVEMHVNRHGAVCGLGPGAEGIVNVTLVVPESEARAVAAAGPPAYADALLARAFPEVARRIGDAVRMRIATCGTFGHTTTRPIADGVLLVGDAAEFVDPFTGEGVYFALRGAEMAAEAITRALRRGDTSSRRLKGYARARRTELRPKYAVCAAVERAVHTPALMRWATPRLRREPELLENLLGVTGDMLSPYRLLSPAFLWAAATA